MKLNLFQYAVLWHPNQDQIKEGKKTILVKEITTMLAKDENTAKMLVVKSLDSKYDEELDQVEIKIINF